MPYIYPITKHNRTQYTVYYLYKSKKIYIGIFVSELQAQKAYDYCHHILDHTLTLEDFIPGIIDFKKWISLINLRDHGVWINQPIYLYETFFKYFLEEKIVLTFDLKDLFFFSTSKISKRGNYLFTTNRHSQSSILTRFGLPPKSTYGKDYEFANGDRYDFRRTNLIIHTHYQGVSCKRSTNKCLYTTRIYHHKPIVVGHYESEVTAAIAYNKAIDTLMTMGVSREYTPNTIPYLTHSEYQAIYEGIRLTPRLKSPAPQKKLTSSKTYRGTYKDKTGFRACIGFHKKQIHLGNYPTEQRAAQAYNFASLYLYGKDGYVNPVNPIICDADEMRIYHKLIKAGVLKTPAVSS
ncbi:MAG: hypothetical protein ACRCW2_12610 [Cellulosilyticaceae bacterium]